MPVKLLISGAFSYVAVEAVRKLREAGCIIRNRTVLLRGVNDDAQTLADLLNGQAKSCRYAMSHPSGKIEILGADAENKMLFKYHQAKNEKDHARIFSKQLAADECWLPDDIKA